MGALTYSLPAKPWRGLVTPCLVFGLPGRRSEPLWAPFPAFTGFVQGAILTPTANAPHAFIRSRNHSSCTPSQCLLSHLSKMYLHCISGPIPKHFNYRFPLCKPCTQAPLSFFYQIALTEQTKQAILRTFLSRSLVETSIRSLTARKVPKMCTKQQQQKGLLSTEHLDFCYSSNHVTLHTLTSATLQKLMLHCFIPFLADVWQQLSREKQERTHAGQERKDGLVPNSLHVTSSYGRAEFGWTDSVGHKLQRPKEDFIPKEAKILTLYMKEKGMPRSSNIWLCWYGISVCLQEKFIAAAVK